ncbi:hypothetical protein M3Y94_00446700 [Aphelenchoides besseyi]|nr:hypothetical protein M3Y94_00446700 [Aphelenchoides besseyi]
MCTRLHRHQIHLISYGFVSFSLIVTGLVFTVFAIFHKDSQIGKVWLAGPTTIVVGLVLCGKVIIDWGPAMSHGRHDSIDSAFMEQYQFAMPNGETKLPIPRTSIVTENPSMKYNSIMRSKNSPNHSMQRIASQRYRTVGHQANLLRENNSIHVNHEHKIDDHILLSKRPLTSSIQPEIDGHVFDCIIYNQMESGSNSNASSYAGLCTACEKDGAVEVEEVKTNFSPQSSSKCDCAGRSSANVANTSRVTTPLRECNCTHIAGNRCTAQQPIAHKHNLCSHSNGNPSYGATDQAPTTPRQQLYQGETFVINEKSYFI